MPEARPTSRWVLPLQAVVALVFTALTVGIAGGLFLYNNTQLTRFAQREARSNFEAVARAVRDERVANRRTSEVFLDTAVLTIDPDMPAERLHAMLVALMREVDRILPSTFGLVLARPDGGLVAAQDLTGVRPPALAGIGGDKATIGLLVVERGSAGATERWTVYDADGREIARTPPVGSDLDGRQRPWYRQALDSSGTILTRPYAFANAPVMGITQARAIGSHPGTVFGIDVTLADVDAILADGRRRFPAFEPFIFTRDGRLVAHPDGERLRARAASADLLPKLDDVGSPLLVALARSFAETGFNQDTLVEAGGQAYFARFEPGDAVAGDFAIGLAVPQSVMMGEASQIRLVLLSAGGTALVIALVLIAIAARRLVAPLRRAAHDLDEIVELRFGGVKPVRSRIAEVADLGRAIATLELALQNFVRYVPFALVRGIVERTFSPALGGRRQRICVMFSDIQGFTGLAETLDADALTRQTSRYFGEVGAELVRSQATIDKYIGDSIMAFWNAPEPQPDFVRLACLGALRAARRVEELNAEFVARGEAPMPTRFGLHTGEAVVGNVGTVDRMNYTALGHTVNLASRLEGLNRQFGTTILASEAVVAAAGAGFDFRHVGETVPRGATRPVKLYALVGATVADEPGLALSGAAIGPATPPIAAGQPL